MGENQKNDDSSSLLKVFLDLGALSEAMLAHLGAMLGRLGAILEQLGDKMWLESAKIAAKSAKMRQDGENGRQKGGRAAPADAAELHAPLKKHHQMKPRAPPGGSTWNLVELRLEAEPGNS